MKRFKAFWKETRLLWTIYLSIVAGLILLVNPIFLAVIPMLAVIFIYFAMVRYDEDGNFIGA
ncbi:MAG: hypothetical protein NTV29_02550 [Planctomycetota bacterium]|nr:hypothetical protein [Planctomycetota bacterium]